MQILLYMPDVAAAEAVLGAHPRAKRIHWSTLAGDRPAAFRAALAEVERKAGFVLLDPPTAKEHLQAIDAACRTALKALPRGVFVLPRGEAHAAWRAAVKPAHAHFHAARRAHVVVKPGDRPVRKALVLAGRSSSPLRWGALVPASLLFLAFVAVAFVFRDAILRRAATAGLELAFGAQADVAGADSTLAPSVAFTGVSVADKDRPLRNLFEFDRLEAGVDVLQLLSGRVHADALVLEGLRFRGPRTESGALERAVEPEPDEPADETDLRFEAALDALLQKLTPPDPEELETVRLARAIERAARDRGARLEQELRSSPIPGQLEEALAAARSLAQLEPPASFGAVAGLGGAAPGAETLQAARAELLAANALGVDGERASIAAVRADIEATRTSLEKARGLVARAKEVQKVASRDVLKVLAFVEELRSVQKGLDEGAGKLQEAGRTLDSARESLVRKSTEAQQRLRTTQALVAAGRQALGQEGAASPAAVTELLSRAREDVGRQRQEVETTLGRIERELAAARAAAERIRDQAREDVAFVRAQPQLLEQALERDRAALLERYSLDALVADELLQAVFGERVAALLKWSLATYLRVQPWLAGRPPGQARTKVKMPTGTTYSFAVAEPRQPGFWIKRASFAGGVTVDGAPFALTGTALDLSSAPALIGRDGRLELRLESADRKIVATAVTTPRGATTVDLSVEGFPVRGRRIENARAPLELTDGTLALGARATFVGETLRTSARVDMAGLRVAPAKPLEERVAFLEPVLAKLNGLSAELELVYEADRIAEFSFRSDQGQVLTAALRSALGGEVEAARRQALERLEQQVSGPRAAALEAVESFLGTAPGAETSLLERVAAAQAALADPRALALGRANELTRTLDLGADPTAALAGMKEELEQIAAESAAVASRTDAACAEQLSGQTQAAALLHEQSGALEGLRKELAEEIRRITALAR